MVVAALSGGVDSATAAAMLVEAGVRVVGITMRLYDARGTVAASGRCCGPRDIEDARRVCSHLGIPFYVVDFAADFERAVIDDFVDSYLQGETPNPCVKCNQYIKFTPLLRRARALGADAVVTGHYARLEPDGAGGVALRRGVDAGKDQSYFLFSMPAGELHAVRFPLGGLSKEEVRRRALAYGLPNAAKAESQEICFVPDGDYAGFVERRALVRRGAAPPAGDLVDGEGAVLGRHGGIHRYTVGQRRGLGAAATGEPLYVTGIDPASHQVAVGPRAAAARTRLAVRDLRWLAPAPASPLDCTVQVRHRAEPIAATVHAAGGTGAAEVDLRGRDVVAAPGQAAVFYDGDRVLGGGWIG
jgi:tRNA-specific 2-thiouridylase